MIKEDDLCFYRDEPVIYRVREVTTKKSTVGDYEFVSVIIETWKEPGGEEIPRDDREAFRCSFDETLFKYSSAEEGLVQHHPELFLFQPNMV